MLLLLCYIYYGDCMKKGFTLIELLAVVVILSIIAVITTPVVIHLISGSRDNLREEQKLAIENAARAWGLKNLSEDDGKVIYNDSEINFISVEVLQSSGALDSKSLEGFNINSDSGVCVRYGSNQLIYSYADSDSEC